MMEKEFPLMKKLIAVVCVSVLMCAIAGCRTSRKFSFKTTGMRVTILTEPAGAEVYQKLPLPGTSQRFIGSTPLENIVVQVVTSIKGDGMSPATFQSMTRQVGNLVVEIRKDGYKRHSTMLAVDPKKTLEHRIDLEPEPVK